MLHGLLFWCEYVKTGNQIKKLKLEEESDSDISEVKNTVQRVSNMKTTILFTIILMKRPVYI